jgi:AAA+ superfamily predicted ATPase
MEQNLKEKLLNSFTKVFECSKDCKLQDSFLDELETELAVISEYFKTTQIQSFFTAVVFGLNYTGNRVDFRDLHRHFDCNPIKMLEFNDVFDALCDKNILKRDKVRHRYRGVTTKHEYSFIEEITEAILKNEPMPDRSQTEFKDVIEILEKVSLLIEARQEDEINTYDLFGQIQQLIDTYTQFPLLKKIKELEFKSIDNTIYLYTIWKTISGYNSVDFGRLLEQIYDNPSRKINYMQDFLMGENPLTKNYFLETVEASFFNDTEIKLTDRSKDMLYSYGIKLFSNKRKKENIIKPESIHAKELYYNENEMKQLDLVNAVLVEEKFAVTQQRLSDKGLPKGVSILLYGAPGTGKTESVLQIAKQTGREIMKVDISQSKSMWFGESEKIIKKIFTSYKDFAQECAITPILFFNEADAIFSRRKSIGSSNVAQTENAMQNIILEELEHFEGILMATTNLANNLDAAFERRFLFKIEFQKPQVATKAKIWKVKLPILSERECEILAGQFDFSGGQIDNIVRKNEIHEIVSDDEFSIQRIIDFCNEELLEKKQSKIGYSI